MQIAKLIRPKSFLRTQSFLKSRLCFFKPYCSNISPQQNLDEEKETVKEIISIFTNHELIRYHSCLSSIYSLENLPKKPTPDFFQSVFEQIHKCGCAPNTLYTFFKWSSTQLASHGTTQTLKSFLFLFKYFCCLGEFPRAKQVIKDMIKTNKPLSDVLDAIKSVGLTSSEYTKLIHNYKDYLFLDEAVLLLLSYENADFISNRGCYNSLMKHLLNNDKMDLFWKVYERLVEANVSPNFFPYNYVIDANCRIKKMEDSKVFLETGRNYYLADLETYELRLKGLLKCGLFNEAINYKNAMMERGMDRWIPYTSIGLFKGNNLSDEQQVMDDEGLISNNVTYKSVIEGYMREGKIEEALSLLDDMIAKNGDSRSILLCINSMMKDFLEQNKMECFWNVYDKMLANKLIRPDESTYNNVIGGYLRDGKVKEAKKLFSEMRNKGYNPSLVTYNVLICGLCKTGYVHRALQLKGSMKSKGMKADRSTYNNLIDALCKLKRFRDAKLFFDEMVFMGLSPDQFTYTALMQEEGSNLNSFISGYIRKNDLHNAVHFLNEMEQRNVFPDIDTYNTLISSLCKMGDIIRARELFDEIPGKGVMVNTWTYVAIIRGYCETGNLLEAFRLLDEMSMKGIKINAYVYRALVNGCCGAGDTKSGLLLFDIMLNPGFKCTTTFHSLIDCFSKSIENHCQSGMIKEAEHLLSEMKIRRMFPTIEAYTSLIHSYIKSGEKSKSVTIIRNIELGACEEKVSDLILDGYFQEYNLKNFELWDELVAKKVVCFRSVFRKSYGCEYGNFLKH